jgi:hypothetical protein
MSRGEKPPPLNLTVAKNRHPTVATVADPPRLIGDREKPTEEVGN